MKVDEKIEKNVINIERALEEVATLRD